MTKILFRPQRGSLADAMAEVVELDATKSAVLAHVKQMCADFEDVIDIQVKHYCFDERIGWDTWLVGVITAESKEPMARGFINGEIKDD